MAADPREAYLNRTYGITVDQYNLLLEAQGGVCAVCGEPPKNYRLSVDHDHKTGLVRGLLCWFDNNKVVGRHRVGTQLRAAADYLDNPPAFEVLGEIEVPKKKRKYKKKKAYEEDELPCELP